MCRQLSLKKFLLVICKLFRLFVNTFTASHKFSLLNRDKLRQPIQTQLSKKETLIADVFRKLRIPKNVVRKMSTKYRFRGLFDKQHGKWDQTVLTSDWHHFYHIYWLLWRQLSSKKSLLVISKILGTFLNTLTACHKYSLLSTDNLTIQFRWNYL